MWVEIKIIKHLSSSLHTLNEENNRWTNGMQSSAGFLLAFKVSSLRSRYFYFLLLDCYPQDDILRNIPESILM